MPDERRSKPTIPVNPRPDAKFEPNPKKRALESRPENGRYNPAPLEDYEHLSPEEQWKTLVKALRDNRRRLLRIPGVTAVDVGYKMVGGFFTDTLALRVHVERKYPDQSWKTVFRDRPYDFIQKRGKHSEADQELFTLKGDAVPMDVIEADYRPVQGIEPPRPRTVFETPKEEAERRRRLDPLVGGISIGSPQVPVGTLGALVWDNTDGSVCILSNWHVLSGDLQAEPGNPCFQPGRFDQGRSSDVVARLKRWSFDSQTDAAIAELTGSRHYCAGEIVSLFQQISGSTDPHLGMRVLKSGRSTGFTWGFIDGLYFSSVIQYSNGVVQVFEDQIHIAPAESDTVISGPGDSGSVWVTETPSDGYKAVGLHFAGDLPHASFGEYALANPMSLVEKRLNFSFRPRFLEIRDEDVVMAQPPLQPLHPLPLQAGLNGHAANGNGAHPVGIRLSRLTGSGGQPDPIQPGSGS